MHRRGHDHEEEEEEEGDSSQRERGQAGKNSNKCSAVTRRGHAATSVTATGGQWRRACGVCLAIYRIKVKRNAAGDYLQLRLKNCTVEQKQFRSVSGPLGK